MLILLTERFKYSFNVTIINMDQEEILRNNFLEYYEMAEYALSKKKYNSAATLYYKALIELCDLELLKKTGRIGVSHTERFELLRDSSPHLYKTASKLFDFYRDSYNKQISEVIFRQFKKEVDNVKDTAI